MKADVRADDHLVSRGYQANFSDGDKRVGIVDATSGEILDRGRPIKSNWTAFGFNAYEREPGVHDDALERAFASVERSVLNEIRLIGPSRRGADQKAATANLFAIHLVRSESFRGAHDLIVEQLRDLDLPSYDDDPEVVARFIVQHGRPPRDRELSEIAHALLNVMVEDKTMFVQSMARNHDKLAEMLNGFHMQLIQVASAVPGLILADVPVVHANLKTGQYGFRDGLALGDADLVVGPLTRRTAVCFTAKHVPDTTITTRRLADTLNAVFMRSALSEVACHPDDLHATRQLHSRLERLPPSFLHGR